MKSAEERAHEKLQTLKSEYEKVSYLVPLQEDFGVRHAINLCADSADSGNNPSTLLRILDSYLEGKNLPPVKYFLRELRIA